MAQHVAGQWVHPIHWDGVARLCRMEAGAAPTVRGRLQGSCASFRFASFRRADQIRQRLRLGRPRALLAAPACCWHHSLDHAYVPAARGRRHFSNSHPRDAFPEQPMLVREALPVHMHAIEFSQVLAVLHGLAPRQCLEWGSGGSTRAILEHCSFIEHYVSIEHDPVWYQRVKTRVTDPRLALHLVLPDRPLGPGRHSRKTIEAWDALAEVDPAVLAGYVAFPATLGRLFDFVLVDGRARRFCLAAGLGLLRSGGVLVLHDAQRRDYHGAIPAQASPVFLEPWKQGQVCLIRKD